MKGFAWLVIFFYTWFVIASANEITLTSDNVDTIIGQNYHVFIKYYAPGCEKCVIFDPIWEKLVDQYADEASIIFGTIDCSAEKNLCKAQGLRSLPALTFFSIESTVAEKYIAQLDEESITQFVANSVSQQCTFKHLDFCNDKQLKWMNNNTDIHFLEVNKLVEDRESDLTKVDEAFENYIKNLQKQGQDAREKYNKFVQDKNLELKWFRAIRREINKSQNYEKNEL